MSHSHLNAIYTALFVTILWSSSWVFIKWGLVEMAPLPFAGIRYSLAALILLPFILTPANRAALGQCNRNHWLLLIGFGLLQYTLTQGAMFIALNYLPAISLSLLLTFTPAMVAILASIFLKEHTSLRDFFGIGIYLIGAYIYFGTNAFDGSQLLGLVFGVLCVLFNAGQTLLGRKVNRDTGLPASLITAISMTAGAAALLSAGVLVQGLPAMGTKSWLIVGWLALANTALAFWLWNHTQSKLTALDSSLINNIMLIQIAILGVVFLGERLNAIQILGLFLAGAGVLWVQFSRLSVKK